MITVCFGLLLLVGMVASKHNFPPYIQLCPSSVKEAGPCIQKNVEIMQPYMEHGIPDLLIPPLNPLEIPKAELKSGSTLASFSDNKIYSLHLFKLNKVEFNLDTLAMNIDVDFPHMEAISSYHFKGKILVFQLDSSGAATGNFTNLKGAITSKGKTFEKKGKKYMKLEDAKIDLSIEGATMFFSDLFKGNQLLSDNANKAINENIHEVINEFLPVLKQTIGGIVTGIANNIFDRFSLDDLFPK